MELNKLKTKKCKDSGVHGTPIYDAPPPFDDQTKPIVSIGSIENADQLQRCLRNKQVQLIAIDDPLVQLCWSVLGEIFTKTILAAYSLLTYSIAV